LEDYFVRMLARPALAITSAIFASQFANAAPQPLLGKSVIVTWQEERQQKRPDEEQLRSVGAAAEFDVYVSDAGRAFSRLRFSVANRRGRLKSGSADAVGGERSARNVNFGGHTMTATMPRGAGGALLVSVTFDNAFQSCSARTLSGKAPGVEAAHAKSIINGQSVDLFSVKTSGETCRIQSGNVFAQ
jgi:hypothetical protein